MADTEYLRSLCGVHPDFPKKGIVFLDIFPIFRNPVATETLITNFVHHLTSETIPKSQTKKIDVVVGLDARGFLLGPIVALRLGAAFVPVRKRGKLPGQCSAAVYEKEYGEDVFEMQSDAIQPGQTVVIIDDLIATGGSARAAGELVDKQGGNTLEYLFIIELAFLQGASKLNAPTYSIVKTDD
ncbi:adenine phosphoribosyltransferase [Punctularia strigosozonata HHB-11173 SS5]|uniref:adenine phosphoribosyltransferase n=1 Tax=Punctularia strigosozonata (strain HHB-11173) TaxID=741275 RepID=UPI0004417794|nr:adenine phosphoribosyltransferase [Punctularia strigosozonata HHB-11173 SS5]EIN10702.1 adenine phosphoribosyltransferase [Punctularia strigosozonata HHB-11173 SS5]